MKIHYWRRRCLAHFRPGIFRASSCRRRCNSATHARHNSLHGSYVRVADISDKCETDVGISNVHRDGFSFLDPRRECELYAWRWLSKQSSWRASEWSIGHCHRRESTYQGMFAAVEKSMIVHRYSSPSGRPFTAESSRPLPPSPPYVCQRVDIRLQIARPEEPPNVGRTCRKPGVG